MAVKSLGPKITIIAMSLVLFLFIMFSAISLRTSGYVLPFGWSVENTATPYPNDLNAPSGYVGICDRILVKSGFPFTTLMPYDDQSGCNDQHNLTALTLDALTAMVMSVGVSWFVVTRAIKRHPK